MLSIRHAGSPRAAAFYAANVAKAANVARVANATAANGATCSAMA
jgi:hypothetical protein